MFSGFTEKDFDTFTIEGLEERMIAIQERIQPKFREIGDFLSDDLATISGNEMYLHIAKHARRKVNPPNDTWLAICHDKRGYKKHPHFQVGLFDDHVFIWFALIYEVPNKKQIAETLLKKIEDVYELIPDDFVISLDHMSKQATKKSDITIEDFETMLNRFRDIKKTEFLVGRHVASNDSLVQNGSDFLNFVKATTEFLIPLYKLSFQTTNE